MQEFLQHRRKGRNLLAQHHTSASTVGSQDSWFGPCFSPLILPFWVDTAFSMLAFPGTFKHVSLHRSQIKQVSELPFGESQKNKLPPIVPPSKPIAPFSPILLPDLLLKLRGWEQVSAN